MGILDSLKPNKMRVITGWVIGFLALFCVIAGGLPIMFLVGIIVFLGTKEYLKILGCKGFFPSPSILFITQIAFVILAGFQRHDLIPIVLVGSTIGAFCAILFKGRQPYIANVATTVLGSIYCGWLPCHFILMRQLSSESLGMLKISNNPGLGFLILTFFVVIATDVGGYYFGRKFGKNLLAPIVSPKKTREGAIGGTLFAVVVSIIIGFIIKLPIYHSIIIGIIITISSQLGDLSESLIKRDAGVKDSGNTLPGHGGFLDRTDGYIFAVPIAYYYFKFFVLYNPIWSDFYLFYDKLCNLLVFN